MATANKDVLEAYEALDAIALASLGNQHESWTVDTSSEVGFVWCDRKPGAWLRYDERMRAEPEIFDGPRPAPAKSMDMEGWNEVFSRVQLYMLPRLRK